jgi:hypothetical protein
LSTLGSEEEVEGRLIHVGEDLGQIIVEGISKNLSFLVRQIHEELETLLGRETLGVLDIPMDASVLRFFRVRIGTRRRCEEHVFVIGLLGAMPFDPFPVDTDIETHGAVLAILQFSVRPARVVDEHATIKDDGGPPPPRRIADGAETETLGSHGFAPVGGREGAGGGRLVLWVVSTCRDHQEVMLADELASLERGRARFLFVTRGGESDELGDAFEKLHDRCARSVHQRAKKRRRTTKLTIGCGRPCED